MQIENTATFCPESVDAWRQWLQKNHLVKSSVWLVYYKKKSKMPSITWSEAVDQALCFGWIDSTSKPIDDDKYMQFFSKRKPNSVWSKINKLKIEQLIHANLMADAGLKSIAIAKQNGSWTILDEVEALIIPPDLDIAFKKYAGAKEYFLSQSASIKKAMLQWLVLAKKTETRQKRIEEIAMLAGQHVKPKQF